MYFSMIHSIPVSEQPVTSMTATDVLLLLLQSRRGCRNVHGAAGTHMSKTSHVNVIRAWLRGRLFDGAKIGFSPLSTWLRQFQ